MSQRRYAPMLLTPCTELPSDEGWTFEPKLDGHRAIAYTAGQPQILSRQGYTVTDQFQGVAAQLPEALEGHSAVVDGELVGFDAEGQHTHNTVRSRTARVVYFVFDLLEIEGVPIIAQPWEERRRRLGELFVPLPNVQLCTTFDDGAALLAAAEQQQLEGVVAKRRASRYQPGKRSRDWRKLKF